MAIKDGRGKAELTRTAWRLLADVIFSLQGHYMSLAAEFGLNPGALKLLNSLDETRPAPMHALAARMSCDASMITWLVDRLEEKGLVKRESLSADRRVKTIVLTDQGKAFKKRFEARLYEPPAALNGLTVQELDALIQALRKLPQTASSC